jgi:NTE family protein
MGAPGRDIALVLGAGGARGLAHIGAIEVLEARGYRIVAIAGSSMGALVGGIHAAGKLAAYRDWILTLQRSQVLRLLDFAFGFPGLIKGERIIGALREMVGDHQIEDLPIRYTAVATDLATQREVWLNRGSLFDAIRASIAIPMVFTPHAVAGRELVDGGLLAPVPIAATRQTPADLVVAIDVNARSARPLLSPEAGVAEDDTPPPLELVAASGLRARLSAWVESFADKKPAPRRQAVARSGMLDLMSNSLDAMQGQLARLQLALDPPDLLIRVPRDSAMFHEYWRAQELVEIGRRAAETALEAGAAVHDPRLLR